MINFENVRETPVPTKYGSTVKNLTFDFLAQNFWRCASIPIYPDIYRIYPDSDISDIKLDLVAPHFSDRQSFRIRMAIPIPKMSMQC